MQDKTLIKISLLMIFIGLPILAVLSFAYQPEINNTQVYTDQELIHINGTLTNLRNKETTTTATLKTCTEIPLVMFDVVKLENNRFATVKGKKDYYNNKLQLLVEELTLK